MYSHSDHEIFIEYFAYRWSVAFLFILWSLPFYLYKMIPSHLPVREVYFGNNSDKSRTLSRTPHPQVSCLNPAMAHPYVPQCVSAVWFKHESWTRCLRQFRMLFTGTLVISEFTWNFLLYRENVLCGLFYPEFNTNFISCNFTLTAGSWCHSCITGSPHILLFRWVIL